MRTGLLLPLLAAFSTACKASLAPKKHDDGTNPFGVEAIESKAPTGDTKETPTPTPGEEKFPGEEPPSTGAQVKEQPAPAKAEEPSTSKWSSIFSAVSAAVGFVTWYRKDAPEWTRSIAWFFSGFGAMCAISRRRRRGGRRRAGCCLAPPPRVRGYHHDEYSEDSDIEPGGGGGQGRPSSLCCARQVMVPTRTISRARRPGQRVKKMPSPPESEEEPDRDPLPKNNNP